MRISLSVREIYMLRTSLEATRAALDSVPPIIRSCDRDELLALMDKLEREEMRARIRKLIAV